MDSLAPQLGHPNAADGDIDDLGVLITAAFGVERAWASKGVCFKYQRAEYGPTPWQYDPGPGANHIIEMALIACAGCRAQYDCARYAMEIRAQAGTWAMPVNVLWWAQKQADRLEMVAAAEAEGVPVARVLGAAYDEAKAAEKAALDDMVAEQALSA